MNNFYFSMQIFVLILTIILTWIHPNLIAPLFNHFVELRNDELKARVYRLAQLNNIKLSNVLVINHSARTTHSNAYIYGLGSAKTIVLSDNLLQNLNDEEILAVVGH